jgi:rubredoxin
MITLWRCNVCGYLHEGEEPPDICPKCKAPKKNFELLDEEETQLMLDARQTKEKYSLIYDHLGEVARLAQEGVALDLDEGCNKIFNHTLEAIQDVQKMIKDELAGHAAECIWVKVSKDGEI